MQADKTKPILFAPIGTYGDVITLIGIAKEMENLGYGIKYGAPEYYDRLVRNHNLDYLVVLILLGL